jgi:hypothetical protein
VNVPSPLSDTVADKFIVSPEHTAALSEVNVFISGFAFITTSADATSDVQLFNVAVTLYVPLSLTCVSVFDAPVPLPAPDHANVAPDWSLDAVNTTCSPSHTSDDVGVISALGIGFIVIVAEPAVDEAVHFLSFRAEIVYVYVPTSVGIVGLYVSVVDFTSVYVLVPSLYVNFHVFRPVNVNATSVKLATSSRQTSCVPPVIVTSGVTLERTVH